MPTLVNLTFDIADLIGADFDVRRTKVWIETNIASGSVIDTTGKVVRLGDVKATVGTDGKGSFVGLFATNSADLNPTGFLYQVYVDYATRADGRKLWSSGWFPLTATSDLALVAPVAGGPVNSTDDAVIASRVNDPASQTRAAMDGLYAPDVSGLRYVLPSGSDTKSGRSWGAAKATIQAAIDALPSTGGTVLIAPGTYAPFATTKPNVVLEGIGGIGQDAIVGPGRVIVSVPSGQWGGQFGVGLGSEQFGGCEVRRIYFEAQAGALGGLKIGRVSNFLLDRIGSAGFLAGIGVQVEGSSSSQYGTIRDSLLMDCQTGLDVVDHNGLRLFGGTIECLPGGSTITAGTTGIKVQSGSEGFRSLGTVIQFQEVGADVTGPNAEIVASRFEATTTGVKFRGAGGTLGPDCHFNNFITGGTGMAVEIVAGATDTRIYPYRHGSMTPVPVTDNGTRTYRDDGLRVERVIPGSLAASTTQVVYVVPAQAAGPVQEYQMKYGELRVHGDVAASSVDYWTVNILLRGTNSQTLATFTSQAGWTSYATIPFAAGGFTLSAGSTMLVQLLKTGAPANAVDPFISFVAVPR